MLFRSGSQRVVKGGNRFLKLAVQHRAVINKINELFAGNFTDADRVLIYALHDKLKDDKKLKKIARTSDAQVFSESIFPKTFDEVAQDSYVEQTEAFTSLFQNKSKYKAIMSALAGMLYKEFNRPTL